MATANKRRDTGREILELVEKLHDERKVPRETILNAICHAIQVAAERHFGVEEGVLVQIDPATGQLIARLGDQDIDPETLGRIAAQSAKQMIIQKIREAESDNIYQEFSMKKGELVVGQITRMEPGTAIVALGKQEALLPRSEQIPGETHHLGERIKAVILEVRKQGQRVKIVLSRTHPDFVRALFQEEIPEIEERIIDIKAIAREAGYRTKVAVVSIDQKVDAVGACVGVRGARIKNITDELNGERIDIVRWNESLQILIPNALQPAKISEVFTYPRLGRAIVLVTDDQLSLAIGRRGQNVRLASKLVGWDIEILTHDELAETLERAERWFGQLPHASPELTTALIEEGFLSYNDISLIDAAELAEFTGLTPEQAEDVVMYAEEYAEEMERSVDEERRAAKEAAELEQQEQLEGADQTEEPVATFDSTTSFMEESTAEPEAARTTAQASPPPATDGAPPAPENTEAHPTATLTSTDADGGPSADASPALTESSDLVTTATTTEVTPEDHHEKP
ncbi:MAG: transcription termination factor NusA [Gemmataceae bacterium]|nr:transcription termination factor NusA [Gemmataceae bacterium]MDW8243891.1 transcription termination factor NusA [Thermogemmata sp.]